MPVASSCWLPSRKLGAAPKSQLKAWLEGEL
jgi:hypothetical protein